TAILPVATTLLRDTSPPLANSTAMIPTASQTSQPTIEPTNIPALIPATSLPAAESPVQLIQDYWRLRSDGNQQTAWGYLSESFRTTTHQNTFSNYVAAWTNDRLCRVEVIRTTIIVQTSDSAQLLVRQAVTSGDTCEQHSEEEYNYFFVLDIGSQ